MHELENPITTREQLYFWLCQIARQLDSGVIIIDPQHDNTIIFANHVFTNMTEYSEDELYGSHISMLRGPLTDLDNESAIFESFQTGLSIKETLFHYRKDATAFWNELSVLPIHDKTGIAQYFLIMAKDVSDQVNIEALITLEREVYASFELGANISTVFEQICEHVSMTFQKKSYACIFLKEHEKLKLVSSSMLPRDYKKLISKIDLKDPVKKQMIDEIISDPFIMTDPNQGNKWGKYQEITKRHNIQSMWNQVIESQDGDIIGMFSIFFEEQIKPRPSDVKFLNRIAPIVTLATKYSNQKKEILQLAYYDKKTGLPNFTSFQNKMKYRSNENSSGVIYIIEAGEYQNVVDLYGRHGGDILLFQLARRLSFIPAFRNALIARYTSSTIIMASEHVQNDNLENYWNEIILEPFTIEDKNVYITLKVGMSNYDHNVLSVEAVKRADTALSAALKSVGTVMKMYDESQVETIQREMAVLALLSSALKNEEFIPMLQPKVNIHSGEIESFEALARWISSEIGFVSPEVFISAAESTGNIHKIDRAILKQVLAWQKKRQDTGKKMYEVAVNISPSHFYYPSFVECTIRLIESYNIDPRYIKLEITESMELENVIRAKKIISELKSYGISTAIDDFGVGYSSLSYLQELPFDEIKIDKSFIDHLSDSRMNAVVKTIIQLSSSLEMKSVAEGIETEEQLKQLQKIGCIVGQGYYFYKPMPLHEIDVLLEEKVKE